jgi:DNA-binding winged helix-turn-helix (wHTH) protein
MINLRHVFGTLAWNLRPKPRGCCFGLFEADLRSGELRKHGVRLKLQDQPFQVLALLLESAGDVVTREELRQRLWPADTFVDFDTGLNSAVKKLRDVLADSADEPRYIETIPRRGYGS